MLSILESTSLFGWAISVVNPSGVALEMVGRSADIGMTIDPETGIAVSDRKASVALSIARLEAAAMGIPRAIADEASRPWVVTFADIGGTSRSFKVIESMPDRALGIVTCLLEAYKAA